MDFKNANELLDLCKKHDLPISEVMRQREIVEGEKEADTVHDAMARVLEIMKMLLLLRSKNRFVPWVD